MADKGRKTNKKSLTKNAAIRQARFVKQRIYVTIKRYKRKEHREMSEKQAGKTDLSSQVIEHTQTSKRIEQMREKLDQLGAELLKQGKSLNDPALLEQANLVRASLKEEQLKQLEQACREDEE